jgi:hypothetical protein
MEIPMRKWQQVVAMVLCILLVFISGCASTGGKSLKIDTRHMVGVQNMRSEMTSMLEGLGYEWQPVRDPVTGQPVKVADTLGQYRMQFRSVGKVTVRVDVHIRKDNRVTGLHFSEVGADQPGAAAIDYYRKLKERTVQRFGAGNVSDKRSFMTP